MTGQLLLAIPLTVHPVRFPQPQPSPSTPKDESAVFETAIVVSSYFDNIENKLQNVIVVFICKKVCLYSQKRAKFCSENVHKFARFEYIAIFFLVV